MLIVYELRLNPESVLSAVEWPEVSQENDALVRARRSLVRILVDRVNRNGVTTENAAAMKGTMADLRFHYNPDQITGFFKLDRCSGTSRGAYKIKEKKDANKSFVDLEVEAIIQALSNVSGMTYDSVYLLFLMS